MNKAMQATAVVVVGLGFSGWANATLIGDTISVEYLAINCTGCFPQIPGQEIFDSATPTVQTGVVELPSFRVSQPGTIGAWSIDIEASSISITANLGSSNYASAGFLGFAFQDLDWTDSPGTIIGVDFLTNDIGLNASRLGFGPDSVSINLESFIGPWNSGQSVVVDITATHVPEPTTLALMGLGLAGVGYKRYRSKKAKAA